MFSTATRGILRNVVCTDVFAALFVTLDTWVAKPDALLEPCFGYVRPKSAQREEQGIHSQGLCFHIPSEYINNDIILLFIMVLNAIILLWITFLRSVWSSPNRMHWL
jgi:hypothetical protein